MSGLQRMSDEDDSRPDDQRSRQRGVRSIGDVLAELLDQYRIRFPAIGVVVVEQRSAER